MRELKEHFWVDYQERRQRCESGQSVVEFALILPMLAALVIAVTFFGQVFSLQMALTGAAYAGARAWAKNPPGGDPSLCSQPACNGAIPDATNNFQNYVVPAITKYLTANGFDGQQVRIFGLKLDDPDLAGKVQGQNGKPSSINLQIGYPMTLPLGAFAQNFVVFPVGGGCVLKRGS